MTTRQNALLVHGWLDDQTREQRGDSECRDVVQLRAERFKILLRLLFCSANPNWMPM